MASDTSLGGTGLSATNLHDSLTEHVRNGSGSGSRRAFDEDNGAVMVDILHLRDHTTQSSSTPSLSAKARNGVIHVLGLERSLSPPRVMQKSSSASSLIAECKAGQEANDRLPVPDPTSKTIVDFEDPAVDALDSAIVSFAQEFPFSTDHPPPTDVLDEQLLTVPILLFVTGSERQSPRRQFRISSPRSIPREISDVTQDDKDPS
ncbi:hypothetical protein PILCRDRAFT_93207 [Piloderma croceum F 1598]|uniref:Uncharacterized protein n=1 Tax=Piloderma croceum (strain F 1598) TaxID=765440 RepID=A0A0C3EKM8_PILCF|nr:hypothetical protein PILCRDRAFT_93207 [Piloderma croceum F 1598]